MASELVLYTDESVKDGRYFSNFYGGALVRSRDLTSVIVDLQQCKANLNLHREVKWQRVTENYLAKYKDLMTRFFEHVRRDAVKIRIMFTQNLHVPRGLSHEQRQNEYYLLYYQFLKHAFGLQFAAQELGPCAIRVNLDQLPRNREDNARFKSFVLALNENRDFRRAGVIFRPDQIAEVQSDDHVLLQCLDIVLGAMAFRLNDGHLQKPLGAAQRGKRTIAKHRLYAHILDEIRSIHPGFNVGISTGRRGARESAWLQSYRHWRFVPRRHDVDRNRSNRKK